MPFNGSGTFARLYSWVVDAAGNVNISSTRTDAEMNGFAAGLTNCVTRDGQSPPSADLPMGGKKLVNLGAATVGTDALNRDTADARYILASGVVNFTLTGALTAATGAFSGNVTIGGTLTTGIIASIANTANGQTLVSGGVQPVGFSHSRTGQVGYHMYNGGPVCEWITYQPLHSTDDSFHVGSLVAGTITDRLIITSAGAVSIPGSLTVTGNVTCPTQSPGDNSTKAATTAFVAASFAPLVSPPFTGTPTAPTAALGTSTTQLATTAFVQAARPPIGQTITSSATVTPTFNDDFVEITAQAAGLTFANPTGSAVNMWGIVVRIKDNATPQTVAFGTQYRGVGVTLPTTTVAGKTTVLGMIFNNALTKWDVVSVAQE